VSRVIPIAIVLALLAGRRVRVSARGGWPAAWSCAHPVRCVPPERSTSVVVRLEPRGWRDLSARSGRYVALMGRSLSIYGTQPRRCNSGSSPTRFAATSEPLGLPLVKWLWRSPIRSLLFFLYIAAIFVVIASLGRRYCSPVAFRRGMFDFW